MKKFAKIITVVVALALCLFSAYTPMVTHGMLHLHAADTEYTAPTQRSGKFDTEAVDTYDLSTWSQPTGNYLESRQVTSETVSELNETALSESALGNRSPYVITTTTKNMPAKGCYTAESITLPANGYYIMEVEYCVNNQKDAATDAYGTFYLDDEHQLMLKGQGWHWASFYIRTDLLEKATVTPSLYLGSPNNEVLGAIYFNSFVVNAVNKDYFNETVFNGNDLKVELGSYVDFTEKDSYQLVKTVANDEFTSSNDAQGSSRKDISVSAIPGRLGFNKQQNYFYTKDGSTSDKVMLLEATDGNAKLTLDNYEFTIQPYETYMFQFYSIATASSDFGGFYFTIDPTEETTERTGLNTALYTVQTLTSDQYHNGWQLNTLFIVGGHEFDETFNLGFCLADASTDATTTGWACIDDLKIYKVSGDYAQDNASSTGVINTYNLNTDTTPEIANAYFDLGTAADLNSTTYPYPLQATSWATNHADSNGIVNLQKCNDRFGSQKPGVISTGVNNNNIYMMHNDQEQLNLVTSPAITTTAGSDTYITFDAYTTLNSGARVHLYTATDMNEDGTLTNPVEISSFNLDANGWWTRYEFKITEPELAITRSYYLQFTMDKTGYTYFDNFNKGTSAAENVQSHVVNLANPLTVDTLWTTSNNEVTLDVHNGVLTATNEDGRKVTIENQFGYELTKELYYEFIITASGSNAHLGLNGYTGLLTIDSEDDNEYKLYIQVSDATNPTLQIILGSTEEDNANVVGSVTVKSISVSKIEEADFTEIKNNANTQASHKLILSEITDDEEDNTSSQGSNTDEENPFGKNWWYLVPTMITAVAALLAITAFLFRKIKFDKHITKKHTSYARDMRLKNQQKKIVAEKAVKVDNVTDESQSN